MSKVFMYAHGGSGNHGCEAIVRATAGLFEKDELYLISSRPDEDKLYGLDDFCHIIKDKSDSVNKLSFGFLSAYLALKLKKDHYPMDLLWSKAAFSSVSDGDIALSIGGDNYCYGGLTAYAMLNRMLKKRGVKTVLWGCSVEPDVVSIPAVAEDLARYDLITARETISYEALKNVNPNTHLVSDPAFRLETKECSLPEGFVPGNTVGINLSPTAIDCESVPGLAFESYCKLIDYIIANTDMQIALIPHVVWNKCDDRIPLRKLYDEFKETKRIVFVEDRGCRELKYIISKCRFFVGARTHATIAAYSSFVPTLVLGYSVKARGIARDLFGTEEGYVIPVQNLSEENELAAAFCNLCKQESLIGNHMSLCMPDYINSASKAKSLINNLRT